MRAIAMSNGYTGKIYVIWDIPHDNVSGYEVIRNGKIIASSFSEEPAEFIHPTMFDHDHHTNLFKKDSLRQLMFVDENIQAYQKYEYRVIAKRYDEEGNLMEENKSDMMFV